MTITKPKLSNERLIVSGDNYEHFIYENPYIYNTVGRPHFGYSEKAKQKRGDNLAVVRNEIRRLVESNVSRHGYEPVFLTFTYERNETSVEVANADFKAFISRINYHHGKSYRYLSVVEFQDRGAVHFHCIFFNMDLEFERREKCGSKVCYAYRLGSC